MKQIKFSAISYCSSQKSALTGQPGFGVRSYSDGFDTSICDYISADKDINDNPQTRVYGYELPDDRKILFSELEANGEVVKDYPVSFTYKTILTPNKTYYALARTVYIGIDYGYFCEQDNARRAGANYYSHILLFDERPPKETFVTVMANNYFGNNVFLPLDYRCTPDNYELTTLLTGEPKPLECQSFNIESPIVASNITSNITELVIAVLQLHINRKLGINGKSIIVKAPHKEAPELISFIKSQLPEYLADELSFQTNYNKSGTPKDIDIIFVNEHFFGGDLYESDHICVNLFTHNNIGIDNNYIYDRIRELANSNDLETLSLLLDYINGIDITADTDYEFAYKLFLLAKSNAAVSINDITAPFISRLNKTKVSDADHATIWGKINGAVNGAIQSQESEQITAALKLMAHSQVSKGVTISSESKAAFTKFIFDIPMNFGEVITRDDLAVIDSFVTVAEIKDSSRLFCALNNMTDAHVWNHFIRYCFSATDIEKQCRLIIRSITEANFTDNEQAETIDLLYNNNFQPIIDYITANPKDIAILAKTVERVCDNRIDLTIQLLKLVQDDANVLPIFSPIVNSYFSSKISSSSNYINGLEEYLNFVNQISTQVANGLNSTRLIDKFTEILQNNASQQSKETITRLLNSGLTITEKSKLVLEDILNIFNGIVPSKVDERAMKMAYSLGKSELIKPMFDMWVDSRISLDSLKNFIASSPQLHNETALIEHMIVKVWTAQLNDKNEKYVLAIIDTVKWSQKEIKSFLERNDDKELKSFLTKSNSFANKLIRKIFKF